MTTRRDVDRLTHDFLMEGQTELADQVYDTVRATIEQRPQRVVIGPWRMPIVNKFVPIGLGAAAIVVAIVIGSQLFRSPEPAVGGPRSVAPTPSDVQNGWIAFSSQPGRRQASETDWASGGDIYLVREGVEPRVIVERGPDMGANVCPQFSPDGSRLLYGASVRGARDLVVLDVGQDGRVSEWRRLRLPGSSSVAPCPRWARSGTHISYLDDADAGVVIVDLNGDPVAPTADDPGRADFTPSETDAPLLSPDGTLRAVAGPVDGVLVGPPDGSADRQVGRGAGYAIATWSPDGTKLLVMSDAGRAATMTMVSVTDPPAEEHIAPSIPVNGLRSWPGRGDVSWQPVFP